MAVDVVSLSLSMYLDRVTEIIFVPLLVLGHEMCSDSSAAQFMSAMFLEVFLNPFELIGLTPTE